MISNARYWFLLFLVLLVTVAGMFVTLFENDSAQFAVMAMRMVQENDFINLFKGPEEYLDKPHMHYWLAAFSFKLFGIHDWAYRIPGILASVLGAYSCFGLGKLLYNVKVGKLAALVFLTGQTIVLSNIDVRTDAVLTGFTIFALWQLSKYIEKGSLSAIALGAFGAAIAFSTKGLIALVFIGLPLLCHLAYTRKWKRFLSWKVLVALVVFALVISPMLYAYYLQFDLHPEKIIRGKGNRSGIFFIFWEQSFERLSGEGIGKNSSDYFFFFHTFLWVFVPWTIIGMLAYVSRVKSFIKLGFRYNPKYEFLTLGGITVIFLIISFAQFKLPHYLNPIIPLFSILTASYLCSLYRFGKFEFFKKLLGIQFLVLGIIFIASVLLCYFVFKVDNVLNYIWKIGLAAIAIFYSLKRENYFFRVITVSVISSLMLNAVLNTHFYPSLLKYQAGSSMAKIVEENDIPVDRIYKLSKNHTWAFDFYNRAPVKLISVNKILNKKNIWLYTNEAEMQDLRSLGYDWDRLFQVDQFRITRLQARFLDPSTRKGVLNKMYLIHVY